MPKMICTVGLLVSFLVFGQCYGQSPSSEGISQRERQALEALFQATDGNHWKNHEGWLGAPGTECSWHGIICERLSAEAKTVSHLDLSENNLNGHVPENLAELVHLQSLTIFGNRLVGRLPNTVVERWLSGQLSISAEAPLLTDVSEIDYESSPSALLCGQHRIVLRADTHAEEYLNQCRNATPNDRTTYCEVKQGKIWWEEFARLAWLLEKNGFFELKPNHDRNVTDSTFVSTRVTRLGKSYEVVEYAGGGPLNLWVIQRSIEGVGALLDWEKSSTQPTYPAWQSPIQQRR